LNLQQAPHTSRGDLSWLSFSPPNFFCPLSLSKQFYLGKKWMSE
jgi:hypothetical protein